MSQNDTDSLGIHVSYEVITTSVQLANSHRKSVSGELVITIIFVLVHAFHLQLNLGCSFL